MIAPAGRTEDQNSVTPETGLLIINADDWGRNREATDRTLDCALHQTISSVSAMVFMVDSERAAGLAAEAQIDVGLHLNLTTNLSAPGCPGRLLHHLEKVATYLKRHRLAQVMYHPGLSRSFQYVVAAQLDEFRRLYHKTPDRVDGHHHMHLCSNVLLPGLLPAGTVARRTFSIQPGEKSFFNRKYRRITDRILARRHQMTDFFFSLSPLEPASRLHRIFALARKFIVEVESHPESADEYRFLMEDEVFLSPRNLRVAPSFALIGERTL